VAHAGARDLRPQRVDVDRLEDRREPNDRAGRRIDVDAADLQQRRGARGRGGCRFSERRAGNPEVADREVELPRQEADLADRDLTAERLGETLLALPLQQWRQRPATPGA
jgi:hypothetical protein